MKFPALVILTALVIPLTARAIVVLNCEELTPPPNCYDCVAAHDLEGVDEYRWSKNTTRGHFSPASGITEIEYITYHCPNPGAWTGQVTITVKLYNAADVQLGSANDQVICAIAT